MTAPLRMTCACCDGEGCAACDGLGHFYHGPAWAYRAPARATAPDVGTTCLLAICRDGSVVADRGTEDEWRYARWAICESPDGKAPARRYRNGGPVGLLRPVAGKAAPLWMSRAVNYARAVGGVRREEAATIAEWYRTHRTGSYPGGVA